jgi:hypothetical protein
MMLRAPTETTHTELTGRWRPAISISPGWWGGIKQTVICQVEERIGYGPIHSASGPVKWKSTYWRKATPEDMDALYSGAWPVLCKRSGIVINLPGMVEAGDSRPGA